MSAAKSKRLQLVARLAELREQQQLVRLQQSRQQQQQQLASLQRLQDFQSDYASNGITVASEDARPIAVSELQNFSRFINDLSAAEQMQRQQLAQAEAICKDNDQAWVKLHARQQRLQELVDKHRIQEEQLSQTLADSENEDRWNGLKQSLKTRNL